MQVSKPRSDGYVEAALRLAEARCLGRKAESRLQRPRSLEQSLTIVVNAEPTDIQATAHSEVDIVEVDRRDELFPSVSDSDGACSRVDPAAASPVKCRGP